MSRLALLLAVAASLLPGTGRAHDLWAERAGDGFVIRYGHAGGEALAIDAARVKAIRCGDGAGPPRDVAAQARFSPTEVRFSAACAVVSAFRDGGFWSLTPDGEVNLPRSEVPDAVRSWTSRQYAKWVDAKSPGARAVLGDELELVPVTDLARARKGDEITVRVLSSGRRVPGAVVEVAERPVGTTDSRGELRLRLRAPGLASILTSVRRRAGEAGADAEVLEASLTFEVGP